MRDHPALKDIWSKLRSKNVIVFIDSEENTSSHISSILDWFDPITKTKLSSEDILLQNGKLLCVRKLLKNMPTTDPRIVGDYDLVFVDQETLKEIRQLS